MKARKTASQISNVQSRKGFGGWVYPHPLGELRRSPQPALHQKLRRHLPPSPPSFAHFYPLTSYSQSTDVWVAYQLDGPAPGKGLVAALRRPESAYTPALP